MLEVVKRRAYGQTWYEITKDMHCSRNTAFNQWRLAREKFDARDAADLYRALGWLVIP
jgi:DNA-binding CsgD family transcriptional regulator